MDVEKLPYTHPGISRIWLFNVYLINNNEGIQAGKGTRLPYSTGSIYLMSLCFNPAVLVPYGSVFNMQYWMNLSWKWFDLPTICKLYYFALPVCFEQSEGQHSTPFSGFGKAACHKPSFLLKKLCTKVLNNFIIQSKELSTLSSIYVAKTMIKVHLL